MSNNVKRIDCCYGGMIIEWSNGNKSGAVLSSGMRDDETSVEFNAAMNAIESIVLAHFCANIDVGSKGYIEGINTAVEACANYCT